MDSTAAPVAAIAVVTTWFAFELSLVQDALPEAYAGMNAFELMLGGITYSFYPVLMLIFILMLIVSGRDFGPMLQAERDALQGANKRVGGAMEEGSASHAYAFNGLIPILTLIAVTFYGLMQTGDGAGLRDILGSADPFKSLMWGSMCSLVAAIVLTVVTRALTLSESIAALEIGLVPMMLAAMILTFAWAISDINEALHTADFIIAQLGDAIAPEWLPVMVFVIAAATSFATGTSWGTMGILIPLVVPLAVTVLQSPDPDVMAFHPVMLASIASVLSGAVWGDHCSPISDTTVLSSLASGCSHVQHVITQIPYAVSVAMVSILCGIIPTSYGLPWWGGLLLGAGVLYVVLMILGKRAEEA